uniref:Immunoglobulin subtype domain-containing protein n=1 Tax=Gadus morhua TaxID=8049 RepID=A0A8C5AP97_GADMO
MHLCSIFLHVLYFLNYWFVALQGSEHHTSAVFLLKGKDLFMEINTQKPNGLFLWRFKPKKIVRHDSDGRTRFFDKRAKLSTENYSLQIENLRLNDSGNYQAVDMGGEEEKVIAEYNVTVQERVSPVVLKGLSGSPSRESCNVTVTCSTLSYSLNSTFTCTNQTCSGDGGDTAEVMTPDVLLQLYLSNGLNAICNHSNKVSWSNATMEIKPLCFEDDVIPHIDHHQRKKIIIISSCLVCFIILGCILVALYKRRKNNKRNINSRGSDDRSPNGDQSPTVYSMLGPSSIPLEPIPPQTAAPEGIYAQVDKHGRA